MKKNYFNKVVDRDLKDLVLNNHNYKKNRLVFYKAVVKNNQKKRRVF